MTGFMKVDGIFLKYKPKILAIILQVISYRNIFSIDLFPSLTYLWQSQRSLMWYYHQRPRLGENPKDRRNPIHKATAILDNESKPASEFPGLALQGTKTACPTGKNSRSSDHPYPLAFYPWRETRRR